MKNYLNQVQGFGLTKNITAHTRINSMGSTLIDHFYCSCLKKVTSSYIFLSDISDHFPLYTKLKYCNLFINKFTIVEHIKDAFHYNIVPYIIFFIQIKLCIILKFII